MIKSINGGFPSSPVVKTLGGSRSSIPGWGTKILYPVRCGQKKKYLWLQFHIVKRDMRGNFHLNFQVLVRKCYGLLRI